MKFPFIIIITELNEGYRVAITVQISKSYSISKYPLCWEWEEISGLKTQTLYGGLIRFQARNLLQFPTWGILRNGVDSCN